jgi:hypothetical protein
VLPSSPLHRHLCFAFFSTSRGIKKTGKIIKPKIKRKKEILKALKEVFFSFCSTERFGREQEEKIIKNVMARGANSTGNEGPSKIILIFIMFK